MPEPKPNLELLSKTLQYIDENPEEWAQYHYGRKTSRGTAGCIAFHGCRLAGLEIEFEQHDTEDGSVAWQWAPTADGKPMMVAAMEAFGLTGYEVYDLFKSSNGREDLERVATQIAARAGEPLWPEEVTPCA